MFDESGVDYGVLTAIGLAIASAVVLVFIFSLLKSSETSDSVVALESACAEVCGDIETVNSMAIPYKAERYYELDGVDVYVSSGYINASGGKATFSRPFAGRIIPGNYSANGTRLWNGTAGMREYLGATFNATGTRERPIDHSSAGGLEDLMRGASMSTLAVPVEVPHGRPLIVEKAFIYTTDGSVMEAEPYVLVYSG